MTFYAPSPVRPAALLVVAAVHVALFCAFMAQRYRVPDPGEGKMLEPVQWLLPLAPREPALPAALPAPMSPPSAARPRKKTSVPTPASPARAAPQEAAATPLPLPAPPAPAADPFSQAPQAITPPSPDALLRGHDWGAGKADHDLRGGKLAKLVRPTDTLQAGLEKAFADAGEAVPPKWFSAPEIREISVPEGRMRAYKIRTAMGTYCFYKPDASLEASYTYKLTNCPREK